jgi:CRP-like cAMP-binding protein/predicted GNAT family N-acyltransferase
MAIEIRGVDGSTHPAALARLRYDVYVREFGRRLPGCDDEQGVLVEDEDSVSTHFAAFDGDEPVACLRLTPIDALGRDSRWRSNYEIGVFPVAEPKQAVLSRLVVRGDHRDTLLAPQLLAAAYDAFRAAEGELLYLRCAANVVSLYEVMGFRRYRPGDTDGDGGFRLPMVMITGDWPYFEAVKSPLLENVQQHAPNVTLGDWFETRFPEHARPASVRVLGKDEFLRSFAARMNDAGIPLLDDLDGDEKEFLFLAAGHEDIAAGQHVLRKGDGGTAMYLILDGAIEVRASRRGHQSVLGTLGAGQLFGEAAFLMGTPRSADVIAIADTHLVVLDQPGFARLSEQHPAVALKVMRNLCRTLCLRLYAHNAG